MNGKRLPYNGKDWGENKEKKRKEKRGTPSIIQSKSERREGEVRERNKAM